MKIKSLLELVFGTAIFLISLVSCIIVSNKVTHFFLPNGASNTINLLLLIIHLIIIVAFVMAIRSLFYKYVKNKDVLNSIFTLTGPIIGISSLYMSDTLHALVKGTATKH